MLKNISNTSKFASYTLKKRQMKGNNIIVIVIKTIDEIYIGGNFLNEVAKYIFRISYTKNNSQFSKIYLNLASIIY